MDPAPPVRIPWFSRWDLLPLAGGLALLSALPRLMLGLPDPIPTHFDARGVANGWTSQAGYPWLAFGLPGGTWLLLLLTGRVFVGSEQDPAGRKCRALAPLRSLLATGLLWMTGIGLLIPRQGQAMILWMLGGFLALTCLGVGFMVRDLKQMPEWKEAAEHHVWGLFYVNAEDPRIWVPKRLGLGWTLNFGHGLSWVILVLLLLPVVLLVALPRTR